MNKAQKKFDPSAIGLKNGHLFGLPNMLEGAKVVVIPVPWEATVSFGTGAQSAPKAVFDASSQIDLYSELMPDAWKQGITMLPISKEWQKKSAKARKMAVKCIKYLQKGGKPNRPALQNKYAYINKTSEELNNWVEAHATVYLKKNKIVAVLGGDHSAPLGLMRALAKERQKFSVLHLDAHADLRDAYEGFEYSHASIMFNALKIPQIKKLIQVGTRDFCEQEANLIKNSNGRVELFSDRDLKNELFAGSSWQKICQKIVGSLTQKVYVSFDIDALESYLCPGTGTPAPGGLTFEQSLYLLEEAVRQGKQIIGFDLCEVSPTKNSTWDATVGAHLLFRLFVVAVKSNENN